MNDLIIIWVEIQIQPLDKYMEVLLALEATVVGTVINMVDGKLDSKNNIKIIF